MAGAPIFVAEHPDEIDVLKVVNLYEMLKT